jgi:hypothetical protein
MTRNKLAPLVVIVIILLAAVLKAPAMMFLAFIALVFMGVSTVISVSNKPAKQKAIETPAKKFIPGVGVVDWITDPRQLESPKVWNPDTIKRMEIELLDTDCREWRKEGEKVIIAEQEAVRKPPPEPKRPKGHHVTCPCPACREVKVQQALVSGVPASVEEFEVTVAEQIEPVAVYRTFHPGGIIRFPDASRDYFTRYKPKSPTNRIPHYRSQNPGFW